MVSFSLKKPNDNRILWVFDALDISNLSKTKRRSVTSWKNKIESLKLTFFNAYMCQSYRDFANFSKIPKVTNKKRRNTLKVETEPRESDILPSQSTENKTALPVGERGDKSINTSLKAPDLSDTFINIQGSSDIWIQRVRSLKLGRFDAHLCQWLIVPDTTYRIVILNEKNEPQMSLYFKPSRYDESVEDEAVRLNEMDKCTEELFKIFTFEKYELSVFSRPRLSDLFVFKYTKHFEHLTIADSLYLMDNADLNWILTELSGEQVKTYKLKEYTKFEGVIKGFNELNLYTTCWLSPPCMREINASLIVVRQEILEDSNPTPLFLRELVRKWAQGVSGKLEYFECTVYANEHLLNDIVSHSGLGTVVPIRRPTTLLVDSRKNIRRNDGEYAFLGYDRSMQRFYFIHLKESNSSLIVPN